MQSFNKFAGVDEASQPHQGSAHPPPPPIPDLESQTAHSLHSRPSRASLPVNRKPSRRTLTSHASGNSLRPPNPQVPDEYYSASANSLPEGGGSQYSEGELPWGPQHPCFPHLNPHVALTSPDYTATRVIRIQRDWLVAGDLYPALQNLYPEILAGHMSEAEFRSVVETLNPMLKNAFDPANVGSWVDAIMGVLTGFMWDSFGLSASKRKVGEIEKWVDGWNKEVESEGKETRLIDLRRTGFLTLDIQIPDPRIDVDEVMP